MGLVLPLVSFAQTTGSNTQVRLSVPIGSMSSVAAEGGLAQYIVGVYGYMLGIVTIVAIIMVVYGGFRYLLGSSYGDVKTGQGIIKDALGGMAVLFLAYFILYNVNPKTVTLQVPGLTRIRSTQVTQRSTDQIIREAIGAADVRTTARTGSVVGCTQTQWTLADASEEVRTRRPTGAQDPLLLLRTRGGASVDSAQCFTRRIGSRKCDANTQCISNVCQGLSPTTENVHEVPASFSAPENTDLGAGTCASTTEVAGQAPATGTSDSPIQTLSCPSDRWNFSDALPGARILLARPAATVTDLVPGARDSLTTSLDACYPRRPSGQRCDIAVQCTSGVCTVATQTTPPTSLAAYSTPTDVAQGLGTCQ